MSIKSIELIVNHVFLNDDIKFNPLQTMKKYERSLHRLQNENCNNCQVSKLMLTEKVGCENNLCCRKPQICCCVLAIYNINSNLERLTMLTSIIFVIEQQLLTERKDEFRFFRGWFHAGSGNRNPLLLDLFVCDWLFRTQQLI